MSPTPPPRPVLLADIGGTWARFALLGDHPRDLRNFRRFRCSDFPSLEAAIDAYLAPGSPEDSGDGVPTPVAEVCLALPGPVDRDEISLANNPWSFSRSALESFLGVPITLVNDFEAQAWASDLLTPEELHFAGAPRPDPRGARVVLGPGTGLGVALRLPGGSILPSEAGHTGFSPATEHELDLMRVLMGRYPRVSVERVVSGPGLANLFEANLVLAGGGAVPAHGIETGSDDPSTPARIAELAAEGHPVARRAVDDFFNMLAAFAGDMALAVWATGGVYVSGAVVRKLAAFLDEDRFRARFENKGRFQGFCAEVAIGWMQVEEPGLLGCAARMTGGPPTAGVPPR
ncbi:MAG: glucokinase [Gemmatimonadales bacterium]|nr:MAG: glucokinase [Gemmatimonadales bacterium]